MAFCHCATGDLPSNGHLGVWLLNPSSGLLSQVLFGHWVMSGTLWAQGFSGMPKACQASLSSIISRSLLKVTSIDSVMLSKHLIFCCPSLFAFNLSQHQCLFQWVSSWHQVAKYWSFSFSISPSSEYSGLVVQKLVVWMQSFLTYWILIVGCHLAPPGQFWGCIPLQPPTLDLANRKHKLRGFTYFPSLL